MKLVVISVLIPMLLGGLAISMNVLLGMSMYQAFIDIFNPFKVMEPVELGVLFFLIVLWILDTSLHLFRKKSQNKKTEQRSR
ncbi:hypothetical protein HNR43_001233 [Anoxybacillus mongoliensis]|uniref:Uncharacterized protein n=1 Tax=Anoxybacillus mongoliensis TaxID=452565 RepID=A0A7W8N6N7_9BACL|nr:hypothetical protein [Anoxybacillus mongoliensis]MBB5355261.1 hypothetical protein [Anoxybacillus mongoliensis]